MPRATALALNKIMVPGFSRQTGLACSACHFQFPQLTPFGRQFKLNGYTMTSLTTIRAHAADTTKRETLGLLPIPPISAMAVASLTTTRTATEVTAYRSAPQGAAGSLDSTAVNAVRGVMPYWRVALPHQFDAGYLMVGTFGIAGSLYPSGVTGLTNRHTDLGFDAQFERPAGDGGAVILRSSFIRESRTLSALVAETPAAAANVSNRLNTLRVNATYQPNTIYGFTAGLFGAGGTTDTLLYAPGAITGSALGSPSTRAYLAEISVNPWQNVRIAGQYIGYTRFNGASQDYDGSGRNASGNGTFYLYTWIAY